MQKITQLQDTLLLHLFQGKQSVIIFLMNGFQLHGHITGFDSFIIILTSAGKQQIIYKHAISTIIPEKPVPLEEALTI